MDRSLHTEPLTMHGAFSVRCQPSDPCSARGPLPLDSVRVLAEPQVGEPMVFVSLDRRHLVRTTKVLGFLQTPSRLVLRTANSQYTLVRLSDEPRPTLAA
jgi:hypothetical protein